MEIAELIVISIGFTGHDIVSQDGSVYIDGGGGGGAFHETCHHWQFVIHWLTSITMATVSDSAS